MPDRSRLRPATPWARDLLAKMTPEARATLEAAIPPRMAVALSGRPPNVVAWLLDDRHYEPRQRAFSNHHSSQWAAVWAVLAIYNARQAENA